MAFAFAVSINPYRFALAWAPAGVLANSQFLRPDDERLDRPLGGIVVDRRLAVLDVARQLRSLLARISDRLAEQALRRHAGCERFDAFTDRLEDRRGLGLAPGLSLTVRDLSHKGKGSRERGRSRFDEFWQSSGDSNHNSKLER